MTPNGCLTVVNLKEERRFVLCPAPVRLRQEATPDTLRPTVSRLAAPRVARRAKRGAQGRNRTTDTAIFSRMLYQLSYLGIPRGSQGANGRRFIVGPSGPVHHALPPAARGAAHAIGGGDACPA
jgi:hypothetical protein